MPLSHLWGALPSHLFLCIFSQRGIGQDKRGRGDQEAVSQQALVRRVCDEAYAALATTRAAAAATAWPRSTEDSPECFFPRPAGPGPLGAPGMAPQGPAHSEPGGALTPDIPTPPHLSAPLRDSKLFVGCLPPYRARSCSCHRLAQLSGAPPRGGRGHSGFGGGAFRGPLSLTAVLSPRVDSKRDF